MAAPGSHSSLLGIFIIFPDKELIDDHLVLGRVERENKATVFNAPNNGNTYYEQYLGMQRIAKIQDTSGPDMSNMHLFKQEPFFDEKVDTM